MQSFLQRRRILRDVKSELTQLRSLKDISFPTDPAQSSSPSDQAQPSSSSSVHDRTSEHASNGLSGEPNLERANDVLPSVEANLEKGPVQDASLNENDDPGTRLARRIRGVKVTEYEGRTVFIVQAYGADDHEISAHNFSWFTKIVMLLVLAGISIVVGFASSIDSPGMEKIAKVFGVSQVAESLATGIYVIGLGSGSFFAGPFSETIGRTPVYIAALFLFCIFLMASGLSPNFGAQLAFRFLAGFFGSTPITCSGGSMSDMLTKDQRTIVFPIYATSVFLGPAIGPLMGGWIIDSSVSWRWVEWTNLIAASLILTVVILILPETYPPVLQRWKATMLQKETGDNRYVAEGDLHSPTFMMRLTESIKRPFILTANEVIIVFVCFYQTVIAIILFTFIDGFDNIFRQVYGVSIGINGTIFMGLAVGLLCTPFMLPLDLKIEEKRMMKIRAAGGDHHPPEDRLFYAWWGGPCIVVGLFWLAWTDYKSISLWSPLVAAGLTGFGVLNVFISCYQYIIDSYEMYAASALSSIALVRYCAAGGMVVVGVPFYNNLGVHYTLTIMACIAAACVPIPIVFYRWGPAMRKRSKYAPTD